MDLLDLFLFLTAEDAKSAEFFYRTQTRPTRARPSRLSESDGGQVAKHCGQVYTDYFFHHEEREVREGGHLGLLGYLVTGCWIRWVRWVIWPSEIRFAPVPSSGATGQAG